MLLGGINAKRKQTGLEPGLIPIRKTWSSVVALWGLWVLSAQSWNMLNARLVACENECLRWTLGVSLSLFVVVGLLWGRSFGRCRASMNV